MNAYAALYSGKNTYDTWIIVDVVDIEPTYFALHLTVQHKYTYETYGKYFYLYSILGIQAVVNVLCYHVKSLLQRLLKRSYIDIQVCHLLGAFPVEPDVEHLEEIQSQITFNCCH